MAIDNYSAKITGNSFLYAEFKEVAKLFNSGLSENEIRLKAIEENIFDYKTIKSIPKRLGAIFERLNLMDKKLLNLLVNAPNEVGRLINLYAIMKSDLLFLEFMEEIIHEKYKTHQRQLVNSDIIKFLDSKIEQSETVAKFTDSTLNKLRQVYIQILLGAGYIKDKKTMELSPPIFYSELANHVEVIGDKRYLRAMLGG